MARGGSRPGAGRPRKSQSASTLKVTAKDIKAAARSEGMSPLEYMLNVMRDDGADLARRDRMAQAAAPFVHAKPGEIDKGKKEQAADAAKTAGQGTGWGDDLRTVN